MTTNQTKLALYSFGGTPTAHYLVDSDDVGTQPPTPVRAPSHHIIALDVSGSMYGDIATVRSTIEKVLTLEEFNDDTLKVTLITYSSHGDCRIHFKRVPVSEVMAAGSKHIEEIRNLRVRGLTGISQALVQAELCIDDSETTAISLHTDGYANDPSPYAESRNINAALDALAKHPNAFCNTVAYRNWCDFTLLDTIANRLSGKCIRAGSAKSVYTALHDTTALLIGGVAPVIDADIGSYDYLCFVSRSAHKCLGGDASLQIRGLKDSDDKTVYRYREITAADFAASHAPLCGTAPLYAFSRTQLANGNPVAAKYALVASRNATLLNAHARALTATQIADMAAGIEEYLYDATTKVASMTAGYGLQQTGPAVIDVLNLLGEHASGFRVDLTALNASYKRMGVKRIAGTRGPDGTIIKPEYKLKATSGVWSDVSGVDLNKNTATANIRLVQKANLVRQADGEVITEVAGIPLDLKDYRNYTVVSDGAINLPELVIRVHTKPLHEALVVCGATHEAFDPKKSILLDFSNWAVVPYDQDFTVPVGTFDKLVRLTVLDKILSGVLKEDAATVAYTAEQVAELKAHCLSPALYFTAPSTTPYTDLKDALSSGSVDTRTTSKIEIGTPEITNIGKLKSGNAYFQRRFTLTDTDGNEVKKPTLDMRGYMVGIKKLSARTKLDAVDVLSYPIYCDFLGVGTNTGTLRDIIQHDVTGLSLNDTADLLMAAGATPATQPAPQGTLLRLHKAVKASVEGIYATHIRPLVFYCGSTGLLPDGGTTMTAEALQAKYPDISLSKAEKEEGMFTEMPGGHLLTVFLQSAYFSTPKGYEEALAINETKAVVAKQASPAPMAAAV